MSPEQAEGKPVDARSDIFSFGCVLYEVLEGRRAFEGSSGMGTLAVLDEHTKLGVLAKLPPAVTPRFLRTSGIAISPDGRWVVFSRSDRDDANLQLLENYR